jgi:hypothetical protein
MQRTIASLIALGLLCIAWPVHAQRASLSGADIDTRGARAVSGRATAPVLALPALRDAEPASWPTTAITFGEGVGSGPARPRLGAGRVTGELVAGATFGGVFALAGVTAGVTAGDVFGRMDRDAACDDVCVELARESRAEKGALIGAAIAYPLGTGLGVAWVGNAGKQKGSLGAAIGGSYLGALAGALVGEAAGSGVIGFLVGAPIGATIAFNSTREFERPGTGLVNLTGGRARWSVPAVSVTPDPLRTQRTMTSIRVMDARF